MARNKQSSETALTVFPWSYRQDRQDFPIRL